jgi:hypothetical protein
VSARRKRLANEAGGKRRTHVAWRQVREHRVVSIAQNDFLPAEVAPIVPSVVRPPRLLPIARFGVPFCASPVTMHANDRSPFARRWAFGSNDKRYVVGLLLKGEKYGQGNSI